MHLMLGLIAEPVVQSVTMIASVRALAAPPTGLMQWATDVIGTWRMIRQVAAPMATHGLEQWDLHLKIAATASNMIPATFAPMALVMMTMSHTPSKGILSPVKKSLIMECITKMALNIARKP